MDEKFDGKYRIPSARLPDWDYNNNGAYFITICTQDRIRYFGKIEEGKMHLSPIGQLAESYWEEIPDHFPHVELGEFVIMPDHMHGILIIDRPSPLEEIQGNGGLPTQMDADMSKITPKAGSVSTIIRSYKSIVTREARKINPDFAWQPRFYDHIISDDASFQRITSYLAENPAQWGIHQPEK